MIPSIKVKQLVLHSYRPSITPKETALLKVKQLVLLQEKGGDVKQFDITPPKALLNRHLKTIVTLNQNLKKYF